MANDVIVVIGSGGIGLAIAKRQGFGKTVLLADFDEKILEAAARGMRDASYTVETQVVDVASRKSVRALADKAATLGPVMQMVNTAGLSPSMAPPAKVLEVDLYGSAVVFEEFERVIASGGAGPHHIQHGRPHDAFNFRASRSMRSPSRRLTTCSPCLSYKATPYRTHWSAT